MRHGLASVATLHVGVVTAVQRFRSDLGLYVHLHCLATDGAYEERCGGELRFLSAAPPTPERMTAVLAQAHEANRADDDDRRDYLLFCAFRSTILGRSRADSPSQTSICPGRSASIFQDSPVARVKSP